MKKALLLGAIVMFFGLGAADTFGQRNDRQRIRRGVRSGEITRDEARVLRERQRQNRTERRGYRSDGTITREERRDIRRDERQHDRQIRRARHNDDRRDGYDNRRNNHRRGNGYYRRGAGSRNHPVFGSDNRRRGRGRN
ncbi:MAG TPA: hypothetical protein VF240_13395 [Pyrinomonadaceae bacterium]